MNLRVNYKGFFFSVVVHIHSNLFLTYETGEWKAWAKFLVEPSSLLVAILLRRNNSLLRLKVT